MLARKLPGFGARLRTNTFLAWGRLGPFVHEVASRHGAVELSSSDLHLVSFCLRSSDSCPSRCCCFALLPLCIEQVRERTVSRSEPFCDRQVSEQGASLALKNLAITAVSNFVEVA